MISFFSVRFGRKALAVVFLFQLVVFGIMLYKYLTADDFLQKNYITQLVISWKGVLQDQNNDDTALDEVGYYLEPGNVKFKFINPMKKHGDPEAIFEQNKKTYDKFMREEIKEPLDIDLKDLRPPAEDSMESYKRANATIVSLVRNSEVIALAQTIRKLERVFNSKYRYPYVFLNDQPFTERFKKRVRKLSKAPMEFVTVPQELWVKPPFIDTAKEKKAVELLQKKNVAHAKETSYHNMCRFYLGNFFRVPALRQYKYYWRIEPSANFYTDLNYDVFRYMEITGKVYGFTVSLYDIPESVESLWPETLKFLNEGDNAAYVKGSGAIQWLLENQQNPKNNEKANEYSTCHFWSNFEIADMDFFRSEAYMKWFDYLDSTGKFYYERWGDAPIHSIGLALFADPLKIHWFRDIGYFHDPYYNCPNGPNTKLCLKGKFSVWNHLSAQNCMPSWIDYVMNSKDSVYSPSGH